MRTIFEGEHVIVLERDGWEFVERKRGKSAVAIVAVTDEGKLILTEQYRRPVDANVIDLPAGLVGDDAIDDPESTARNELEEEAGYTCERVEALASGPTSPGITSETVTLYRALGLRRTGMGGGVGNEKITVHEVPVGDIEEWLKKQSALIDLKVWAALHFVI